MCSYFEWLDQYWQSWPDRHITCTCGLSWPSPKWAQKIVIKCEHSPSLNGKSGISYKTLEYNTFTCYTWSDSCIYIGDYIYEFWIYLFIYLFINHLLSLTGSRRLCCCSSDVRTSFTYYPSRSWSLTLIAKKPIALPHAYRFVSFVRYSTIMTSNHFFEFKS